MEKQLKPTDLRELGHVNITELQEKVQKIPDWMWENENSAKPNKFKVLTVTQHIVFAFVDSLKDYRHYHHRPLWQMWRTTIEPVLLETVKPYGYQQPHFPRIMLAKLPANSQIERHIDGAVAAQFPHKIHVPLFTNPETFFFHDHQHYHFEVGKAYEVNNTIAHWAENNGNTDRIHLIFECFDGTKL